MEEKRLIGLPSACNFVYRAAGIVRYLGEARQFSFRSVCVDFEEYMHSIDDILIGGGFDEIHLSIWMS